MVLGQPRNLGFSVFGDIDHIEVLKGPQGTLFGKNASAGVVYAVTKRPEMGVTSTSGSIKYGERNEFRTDTTLNIPIAENLAARLTGVYQRQSGYLTNAYDNTSGGNYRDYAVRGKLLWQPSSDVEVYLIGGIQNHRDDGIGGLGTARVVAPYTAVGYPTNPNSHFLIDFPALFDEAGITPGPNNTEYSHNFKDYVYIRQRDIQANVKVNMGEFTLTSITAYSHSNTGSWFDQDYSQIDFYDINNGRLKAHQLSQEIRLNSPVGGFLDYVVGAFAWDQNTDAIERSAGRIGNNYPVGTYYSFTGAMANYEARIRSYAAFGEANAHLTDQLTLTGGLRFTRDRVYGAYFPSADIDYAFLGTPNPATSGVKKASNLSGKVTLAYEPTDDLMAYATYSRGYKAPAVGTSGGTLRLLDPEKVTNYEVGVRAQFFDRKVTFNGTLFYEKFKDFQATVAVLGADGITRSLLANAPAVVSKGFEGSLTIQPTPDFTLNGTLSYTPTEYKDFNAPCYAEQPRLPLAQAAPGVCVTLPGGGTQMNVDGYPSIHAPKTTFTIGGDYSPLISENLRLFLNANYYHRSGIWSSAGNPNTKVAGYGLLNGNIGIGKADGSIKVTLYARNLLDKLYWATINTMVFGSTGSYNQSYSGGGARTLGARLDYSF
jgi:iron complex outermembrane receptor protein